MTKELRSVAVDGSVHGPHCRRGDGTLMCEWPEQHDPAFVLAVPSEPVVARPRVVARRLNPASATERSAARLSGYHHRFSGRALRGLAAVVVIATMVLGIGAVASSRQADAAAPPPSVTQVDFAQCANGTALPQSTSCTGGWINGILNHNNSVFFEDQVTAQRLEVDVPAGAAANASDAICAGDNRCHTVQIHYQTRKGSSENHAYDSLATWNYTLTGANKDQGLNSSDIVGGPASTFPIPADPTALAPFGTSLTATDPTSNHQLTGQVITAYGATLKGVSVPVHDCTAAGNCNVASTDDYATVTIAFDVPSFSADQKVQLLFGGHLAASLGPRGWGAGFGSAFISGGPYHFKWIAVDGASIGNRDNQIQGSSIFVTPTIATTPNPSSGTVPVTLNDSATLSGAVPGATGSITFNLYGPGDTTCSGTVLYTQEVTVNGPGTYSTSPGYQAQSTGTYHWTAAYSGDNSDSPVSSGCADEPVTVGPKSPTIATQASPTTGTVGVQINAGDTATFSGAFNPTGSVTFTLYSDAACTVSTGLTGSGAISGGVASFSGSFTPTATGTYYWIASYAGDANNNGFTTKCGDNNEQLVIGKVSPSIVTTPNPSSGTVGVTLNDSATLSGGFNPTGSITFNLYGPGDASCTSSLFTNTVPVSGNGTYNTSSGFLSNAAGTWNWTASYSGDSNNKSATSGCGQEQVTLTGGNFGFTPGFWANKNGHQLINKDSLLPVLLGDPAKVLRYFNVTTIKQSDTILPPPNGCDVTIFNCAVTGLSDSLSVGTFENLASQTLALSYNVEYYNVIGKAFGTETLGQLGATPVLGLTSSSTVQDVLNLANQLIANSAAGGTTTQAQANAMINLISYIDSQ